MHSCPQISTVSLCLWVWLQQQSETMVFLLHVRLAAADLPRPWCLLGVNTTRNLCTLTSADPFRQSPVLTCPLLSVSFFFLLPSLCSHKWLKAKVSPVYHMTHYAAMYYGQNPENPRTSDHCCHFPCYFPLTDLQSLFPAQNTHSVVVSLTLLYMSCVMCSSLTVHQFIFSLCRLPRHSTIQHVCRFTILRLFEFLKPQKINLLI